jgi:hypothetical protein
MSENRVVSGISGPKREEVAGGCRKFHNKELHNLQSLPNDICIRVITSRER